MKRILTAVVGAALLVGPWLFASPVRLFKDWRTSPDWPSVEAKVVSVRLVDNNPTRPTGSMRTDDTHYVVRVEYEYEGRRRAASYRLEPMFSFLSHDLPREGERTRVLVNPQRPDETYRKPTEILLLALVLLGCSIFGAYLLWRSLTGRVDDLVHDE